MKLAGTTALVTGANRGLGRAFVEALRGAGCARIYAAVRDADGNAGDGIVVPIRSTSPMRRSRRRRGALQRRRIS